MYYLDISGAEALSRCKGITEHLLMMLTIKENNINNSYTFTS